jgi:hypothetical protein
MIAAAMKLLRKWLNNERRYSASNIGAIAVFGLIGLVCINAQGVAGVTPYLPLLAGAAMRSSVILPRYNSLDEAPFLHKST